MVWQVSSRFQPPQGPGGEHEAGWGNTLTPGWELTSSTESLAPSWSGPRAVTPGIETLLPGGPRHSRGDAAASGKEPPEGSHGRVFSNRRNAGGHGHRTPQTRLPQTDGWPEGDCGPQGAGSRRICGAAVSEPRVCTGGRGAPARVREGPLPHARAEPTAAQGHCLVMDGRPLGPLLCPQVDLIIYHEMKFFSCLSRYIKSL